MISLMFTGQDGEAGKASFERALVALKKGAARGLHAGRTEIRRRERHDDLQALGARRQEDRTRRSSTSSSTPSRAAIDEVTQKDRSTRDDGDLVRSVKGDTYRVGPFLRSLPDPDRIGRPLRLRRRVGLQLVHDDLDGRLELRVAAGDDVLRRLLDLDVGRDAHVLDAEALARVPEGQVRARSRCRRPSAPGKPRMPTRPPQVAVPTSLPIPNFRHM
ncbi:MAG: hypothetical protein M0C28_45040 [Candidatus Moduliflexus flocculans]|nr:hypothetical protein [Candidatus Moduliflexus flocculans]